MSEPSKTLRCAAIGVGRMGRHHARVYTQLPGCSLVAVVDQSAERRDAVAKDRGCAAFGTVQELLAAAPSLGGLDAVSIAVPTTYHLATARPLLEAGVACLIEKPLANTLEDAEEIKRLAARHKATLMVGHIERYNPAVRALARQAGPAIAPRFIEIHRVSPMTFRSVDVSVVLDMMIHDLDVVLMLMGGREPDEVRASAVSLITEHDDVCNARLEFTTPAGRAVANITASRLAFKTERKMRIVSEDAYVSIDYAAKSGVLVRKTANAAQLDDVRTRLRAGEDLSSLNYAELVDIEPLSVDDAEPLRAELEDFVNAVRRGERPPIDAADGFANVRTAQRIIEAARGAR